MKKHIKKIVICILLIICSFMYSHIDRAVRIYDKNIDAGEYRSAGIVEGESFQQSFISEEDSIDGVDLMCTVNGDVSSVKLEYELADEQGNIKAKGEILPEKIKTDKFYKIRFDKIKECEGKEFTFSVRQKVDKENVGIAFYYEDKVENGTTMRILGNEVPGTSIMKVITHEFDLETFCVLLGFLAFIFLFMRSLYKLFS